MAGTFADDLVDMHDQGFSLPSIQVSLERHLALLMDEDPAAERRRLAANFESRRRGTPLADEILSLLRTGTGNERAGPHEPLS
jgi:hypothetical protein